MITWRINNMLLKNQWVNEEIKKEILKYLETNDNENTTIQNPWDAAKAVLRGEFIKIQVFLKKTNKQTNSNNLTYHLKELEKEEQTKPKIIRRKEIIQIREEINKIKIWTSLVVQWLRLHASNARNVGLIPGQGTKIPHAMWHGQKKFFNK